MDLKELLGDLYTEEISNRIAEKGVKLADLSKGQYVSSEKALSDQKALAKEISDLKKQVANSKQEKLTEQELIQQQLEEMKSSLLEKTTELNRVSAEKIFATAGLTEEDYKDIIDNVVSDDTDKTIAIANTMANFVTKQKAIATENAKKEITANQPTPPAGSVTKELTKADFDKMSYSEMVNLMQTNPEVYNKISG